MSVKTLAAASAKWKGMKTVPSGDRPVTNSRAVMVPRRLVTIEKVEEIPADQVKDGSVRQKLGGK